MVDDGAQPSGPLAEAVGQDTSGRATTEGHRRHHSRHLALRRSVWGAAAVMVAGLVIAVPVGMASSATATPSAVTSRAAAHATQTTPAPPSRPVSTPTVAAPTIPTTPTTPAGSVPASSPAATPAPTPSVAALVAHVEAAGIVPASTWSWSMGDTAAPCGVISSAGGAAGCTSWSSGVEHTVFSGSPSLALVAHEVANAEVEQFAIPTLLQEVSTAAAGTSWSSTDAVASCLVAHFMGFQDGVAGTWQCPVALAASVDAHIHDTVVTTQTTAVCGMSSGIASTLTFTASSGTLTVTTPSSGQTAPAGVPVTVSGVGTFTARDLGGTASVAGVCQG